MKNDKKQCIKCLHKEVCDDYKNSTNIDFSAEYCNEYLDCGMIELAFLDKKISVYNYIKLLKEELLYGYFDCYSDVETYIDETFIKLIKGEKQ